jgi:hypothetical protein
MKHAEFHATHSSPPPEQRTVRSKMVHHRGRGRRGAQEAQRRDTARFIRLYSSRGGAYSVWLALVVAARRRDRSFVLSEIAAAQAYLQADKHVGKVVVWI